jgi:hypothetical protein
LTTSVRSASRPPRDKSLGYKTAPDKSGFAPKSPIDRALFCSPHIYLRAFSAERGDVFNYRVLPSRDTYRVGLPLCQPLHLVHLPVVQY